MNGQPNPSARIPLFSQPVLPRGLAVLITLLVFTHLSTLLMNQPASYWLDAHYARTELPFSFLLAGGAWIYLGISSLYLIGIGLLLGRLNSAAGLFLGAALALPHSLGLYRTIQCGFQPIYQAHSAFGCSAHRETSIILFFLLFALFLLADRLPQGWLAWIRRIAIPLAVLWVLLMGYGVLRAALPPSSPWRPLAPKHNPGPRTMAAIAYDSQRQRAVLFGGITRWDGKAWVYDNSTWEWDGQDWQQIFPPVSPTGRARHAMAYDEGRGRVVLYGGDNASGTLADLWEWDGTTWHRMCPVCNPAARLGHKLLFNHELQQIVVYGGQDGGTGFAEAWTWDGEAWNYFPFESSAPAVYNAPMIHDPAADRTISFMGGDWGGTWIWEASTWRKLAPAFQPPLRDQAILVYDPLHDHSVLFGGVNDSATLFSDTWILTGETWEQLDVPGPSQRHRTAAFYDPVRRSIILYGGESKGSIYADMWELVLPGGNQP
jgi:hypothetical protein